MTRFIRSVAVAIAAALVLQLAAPGEAADIGNWTGSDRSWNHPDFSGISSTMVTAGHTVLGNASMTAANLAAADMFIIGEASSTPSAGELSDLASWVQSGGCLLLFTDSGFDGGSGGNAILNGIGSTIDILNIGNTAAGPFAGGSFATTGPPYNLVGQFMATSPGNQVSGGTVLYPQGMNAEDLGSGHVFVFGDRFDHNFSVPTSFNNNGRLFLNIAAGCPIPEPASGAIAVVAAVFMAMPIRRRR